MRVEWSKWFSPEDLVGQALSLKPFRVNHPTFKCNWYLKRTPFLLPLFENFNKCNLYNDFLRSPNHTLCYSIYAQEQITPKWVRLGGVYWINWIWDPVYSISFSQIMACQYNSRPLQYHKAHKMPSTLPETYQPRNQPNLRLHTHKNCQYPMSSLAIPNRHLRYSILVSL